MTISIINKASKHSNPFQTKLRMPKINIRHSSSLTYHHHHSTMAMSPLQEPLKYNKDEVCLEYMLIDCTSQNLI